MSKILIIGEKPSIARKILEGLKIDGVFRDQEGYYESAKYIITYCVGHLLSQKMPGEIDETFKSWNLENLPFRFKEIPLKASESTKEQLSVIKGLFKRKDISEIVNACDADREGELIFMNLIEYLKPSCKNLTRMWIKSVATPEIMKKQFEERESETFYTNLYKSAKARAKADYLLGLNATEAMSVKYKSKLSIGRVITPTLKILVDLENKIKNFKPEPFYKVTCDTNKIKELGYVSDLLDNNRFGKKEDAEKLIKEVGLGEAVVTQFNKKTETEQPFKLFSLSDLQIECSKKYRLSAQEVLDACQGLYEKYGLTTYPRTDENMISKEMAEQSDKILKSLKSSFSDYISKIEKNKYKLNKGCVAKKDIASHEALTPTGKTLTESLYKSLSLSERNVYNEIVLRFIANFYPAAEYSIINIEIERKKEKFTTKSKTLKVPGFYEVYGKKADKEASYDIQKGDHLNITSFNIIEGQTEPPKRLTEGSLVKVMQSPMKYLESKEDKEILNEAGGLGTEATRAGIIENLKKYGFIEIKRNSIYATDKGINLINLIPGEEIKSVPLTASFEQQLKKIKEGTYEPEAFLDNIMKLVDKFIKEVKDSENSYKEVKTKLGEICKCPECGSSIIKGKYGYQCMDWQNCKVNIFYNATKNLGGKKISEQVAKELLTQGKTKKKVELKSKAGKKYSAYLTYKYIKEEKYPNKITIEF